MFTPLEIAERIKLCAKQKGVSVKAALKEAGVGEKMVSNMSGKKGSYPQSDKLAQIADFFSCSVDYLLGREETKNTAVSIAEDSGAKKLIEIYDQLTDDAQKELLNFAEYMTNKENNLRKVDNSKKAI